MSGRQLSWKSRATHVAVFLVCLLLGGAFAAVRWHAPEAPPKPVLLVDPADLNLGTVLQQPDLHVSLPIRNVSDRDIVVERLTASCNCTKPAPDSFRIAAGETLPVSLTIDLLKSVPDAGVPEESFLVTLTAVFENPESAPLQWALHGIVRRSLRVSPPVINLQGANEIVQGVRSPTVTLSVTPQIDIVSLKAEWTPSEADVLLEGPDPRGRYHVNYTPRNDVPRGSLNSRITLLATLADGTSGLSVEIPVQGRVVPPVRLSPERLVVLNTAAIGDRHSSVLTTTLIPLDGQDWRVVSVDGVPDWLSINSELVPGALLLEIVDHPAREQLLSLVVHAQSAHGDNEKLSLLINVDHIADHPP